MDQKDLNRIKLVLVEKNVLPNGLQENYTKILQPYLSGVQIQHSQVWKRCLK